MDETTYSPLTADLQAALQQGLARAAALANADSVPTAIQIQSLYDRFLTQGAPPDEEDVISLGLAFGQLIVDRGGFEWVRIKDEYGEETCVAYPGKKLSCAPISMIQKRLEGQEATRVEVLALETVERLRDLAVGGETANRPS